MAVAQIITIRLVGLISKVVNANIHRMDVVQIIELLPEAMKMLVVVVNTKNMAVAQVLKQLICFFFFFSIKISEKKLNFIFSPFLDKVSPAQGKKRIVESRDCVTQIVC